MAMAKRAKEIKKHLQKDRTTNQERKVKKKRARKRKPRETLQQKMKRITGSRKGRFPL